MRLNPHNLLHMSLHTVHVATHKQYSMSACYKLSINKSMTWASPYYMQPNLPTQQQREHFLS